MREVMEYALLRHTSLTYEDIKNMPERKVWRMYAMLLYELEEQERAKKRASGKETLRPPTKR